MAVIIIIASLIIVTGTILGLLITNQTRTINQLQADIKSKDNDLVQGINATLLNTANKVDDIEKENYRMHSELKDTLNGGLKEVRESTDSQLKEIRNTVDEKLSETLTRNLNDSFRTVSDQLSNLYKSLGEMKEMNNDVTNNVTQLNRLMNNVKARGSWAEAQLGNILDETIPGMYVRNYKPAGMSSSNQDVVEFAIKIPSSNGSVVYLPLDSKLPMEDYIRLTAAQDIGDMAGIQEARKALESRVISEAKDVSKYIHVPETTPYAILYLATEGLYAEILSSKNGVYEKIRTMNVMVAGPNTITALLTSLSLGYRAIAVNEKASEIEKLLAVTRAQYAKFADSLSKTRKNLDAASKALDDVQKRNEIMTGKLRKVDVLDNNDPDILAIDAEVGD